LVPKQRQPAGPEPIEVAQKFSAGDEIDRMRAGACRAQGWMHGRSRLLAGIDDCPVVTT